MDWGGYSRCPSRPIRFTGAAAGWQRITTLLTAEDGSTQDVVTTMTNSTLADQATVYRDTLAASTQSEFQKLNYTVDGRCCHDHGKSSRSPIQHEHQWHYWFSKRQQCQPHCKRGSKRLEHHCELGGGAGVPNANDNVFFHCWQQRRVVWP